MPRVRDPRPVLPPSALLRLIWLASPALPVGGFSYSEGLEAAVEHGRVDGEAAARQWLLDQMQLQQARGEWPLVASAARAWARGDLTAVADANRWVTTTRETSELRQQTEQMGRSLADWLRQRWPDDPRPAQLAALTPAPNWPTALGLALTLSGAPLREALMAVGFGWAENMVQAAVKAVPLGQAGGQRLLDALVDALPAAVDEALDRARHGEAQRINFSPMLAVLSARHEAQYSRLFRS
jgi:urease accessory protein